MPPSCKNIDISPSTICILNVTCDEYVVLRASVDESDEWWSGWDLTNHIGTVAVKIFGS